MRNSKERFSDRVDDYKKYRPGYPKEALEFVINTCKVNKNWKIADIGSGTGISTQALIEECGCEVFAVEPNEKMRNEAEKSLSNNNLFWSINGSSDDTHLKDKSINLIAVFQAFHWFDRQRTRVEFKRIITEPNWVLLMWNDRKTGGSGFLEGYEEILRMLPEYPKVNHKNIERQEIEDFMKNHELTCMEFKNSQRFDFDGLKGRFFSSSYTPSFGTEEHELQIEKLKDLFSRTNKNGQVEFQYSTQLFLGRFLQ
jgi:ubiquinone/menaquinone biosynthesis C-methylase UbiE